jgi:NADH:ubiquinone reductase (H+-translocating)
MMAQPAMQQGKWLGENIVKKINKKPLKPFVYNDKGSMATIGRNKAVVDLPKFHFQRCFCLVCLDFCALVFPYWI